jgi:hypothetical protein
VALRSASSAAADSELCAKQIRATATALKSRYDEVDFILSSFIATKPHWKTRTVAVFAEKRIRERDEDLG